MTKPLSKYNQAQRDKAVTRANRIATMRNSGKTFDQIGTKFGISRQRAQQLYKAITAMRNVA